MDESHSAPVQLAPVLCLQVIALCERLAGQDAKVTTVPVGVLRATRQITRFFQWTRDVADRLAFSEVSPTVVPSLENLPQVKLESLPQVCVLLYCTALYCTVQYCNILYCIGLLAQVLTSNGVYSAPMADTYALLGADPKAVTSLEQYLQEYYTRILKKLKDLKASSKQGDFYL